ncbi:MAG TPA: hypothetical protein VHC22_27130 [Pirellulales bacterium]|nr:hypothetical protein [Pirellulales bacterium]
MSFHYYFHGGPFNGPHSVPRALGEWVVLPIDEPQCAATSDAALAAYRQEVVHGSACYVFKYCLTRDLRRIH